MLDMVMDKARLRSGQLSGWGGGGGGHDDEHYDGSATQDEVSVINLIIKVISNQIYS